MENQLHSFEQWAGIYQTQFEKMLKASNIGIECAEKITQLQLNLMREICNQSAESLRHGGNGDASQGFAGLQSVPVFEKTMETTNAIYETFNDMNKKIFDVTAAPSTPRTGGTVSSNKK